MRRKILLRMAMHWSWLPREVPITEGTELGWMGPWITCSSVLLNAIIMCYFTAFRRHFLRNK